MRRPDSSDNPLPNRVVRKNGDDDPSLCEALLFVADEHGLATNGDEMAWGDVEELFWAAFGPLTPKSV